MTTELPGPPKSDLWTDVFRKKSSVVAREIAGENILVPVRAELAKLHRLFTLNQVGAFIWQQLDGHTDLAAIHRRLVEHFEVSDEEAREDLLEYAQLLLESQLIEKLETS